MYLGDPGKAHLLVNLSGTQPPKRSQTGIYDDALWCESCERRSSEIDRDAAEYLSRAELATPLQEADNRPYQAPDGRVLVWELKHAVPLRLHLFVLSVLWRASASTRDELKAFSLGPYQDRIKAILRSSDPIELASYGYLLRQERQHELRGGFILPTSVRYDEVNFVRFHGGGFCFDVKVSKAPMPDCFVALANGPVRPVRFMKFSLVETKEGQKLASAVRRASKLSRR